MTIEDYKKKVGQSNKNTKNYFRSLITRVFISISLILCTLIICNLSTTAKEFIKKNLFETDFKFSSINKLYNKYFLNINKKEDDTKVSKESILEYTASNDYYDGVKLSINENYPIKLLNSGIVVFIGDKENYGNTIIIQQSNGVDAWYGNIKNVNIKLYDYVEKNTIIGSADKILYLVFQKNGIFQNYNEYLE